MSLPSRLNVVTLGVADVARSTAFYKALGWRHSASGSNEYVSFFQLGATVLSIFGRAALAEDAGVANSAPGFGGISLALNFADTAGVDLAMADAVAAGATVKKPPAPTFWGGYGGYFADPDGHLWELAHNPFWPLGADGSAVLPA